MSWIVWELFVTTVEGTCLASLLYCHLGPIPGRKVYIWIYLLVLVAATSWLNSVDTTNGIITLAVMPIVDLAFAFFCFGGKPTQRLIWGAVCATAVLATNLIVASILPFFSGVRIANTLVPSVARMGVQIAYLAVLIFLCFCLANVRSVGPLRLGWGSTAALLCVLVIGVLASTVVVGLASSAEQTEHERAALVSVSGAIVAMMSLTIVLTETAGKATAKRLTAEREVERVKSDQEYVRCTEALYRAWNHDVRNAFDVLCLYAKNNETDKMTEYLSALRKQYETLPEIQFTGAGDVDAMLRLKLALASASGISHQLAPCSLQGVEVDEATLSLVLGNLLDNAIEACNRMPPDKERYITIEMKPTANYVVIKIINSTDQECRYDSSGNLISTKGGTHGNGHVRLKQMLANRGFYQIQGKPTYFYVTLAIPVRTTRLHDGERAR